MPPEIFRDRVKQEKEVDVGAFDGRPIAAPERFI
jgi:hypothetical protein